MRRNGFTMVELIFVIIIIGILSAAAIPKFGDIKDKAKINSELNVMNSMDSAIVSAIALREDDYGDRNVKWHKVDISDGRLDARFTAVQAYNTEVNTAKKVLSYILKKSDKLKIVGAASTNGTDIVAWSTATKPVNDILFIAGPASDATLGVEVPSNASGQDLLGKPDKNDLWVFNPNTFDINITSSATYPLHTSPTLVPAESIALLDVNGTAQLTPGGSSTNIRDLSVIRSDTTTAAVANDVLEIRN
jgi:prepilin-type N-terminal cleavage/methylation domain-containing protein